MSGFRLGAVGVGPQKTASSWLHACLAEHPGICVPHGVKETFFFDERYEKGLNWYQSQFKPRAPDQLYCEIGPTYFDAPAAVQRIWQHNPACRIIVTLRDPVERAFSMYLHLRKADALTESFEAALRSTPRILSGSKYARHLPAWIEAFGRERVLILLQEDIQQQPEQVLAEVHEFLGIGVGPVPAVAHERVNVRSLPAHPRLARLAAQATRWLRSHRLHAIVEVAKPWARRFVYDSHQGPLPALADATARELELSFADDIQYVEQLTGRDLSHWRNRSGAVPARREASPAHSASAK